MTQEFIPYESALALKELGLDEYCFGIWAAGQLVIGDDISEYPKNVESLAPLYQQAFRWFRNKHNLHGIVSYYGKNQWDIELLDYKGNQLVEIENNTFWTYEEAELACLIKLIEIVKIK